MGACISIPITLTHRSLNLGQALTHPVLRSICVLRLHPPSLSLFPTRLFCSGPLPLTRPHSPYISPEAPMRRCNAVEEITYPTEDMNAKLRVPWMEKLQGMLKLANNRAGIDWNGGRPSPVREKEGVHSHWEGDSKSY